LIDWPNQAILSTDKRPLGECRMSWFTKFNPKARLQGERDVIAIMFLQCFIPKLELDVLKNNFLLMQDYSTRDLARGCLQSFLNDMNQALGPHLSSVQVYNNSKNAEAVSIGISRDVDSHIWSGEVIGPERLTFDLETLTKTLDLMLFDAGMRALKAADRKAINMSVDAVSELVESAFSYISQKRITYRNPYGTSDFWNLRA